MGDEGAEEVGVGMAWRRRRDDKHGDESGGERCDGESDREKDVSSTYGGSNQINHAASLLRRSDRLPRTRRHGCINRSCTSLETAKSELFQSPRSHNIAASPHWKMWRALANDVSCEVTHLPATFFPFPFGEYLSHFSVLGCLTAPSLLSVQILLPPLQQARDGSAT